MIRKEIYTFCILYTYVFKKLQLIKNVGVSHGVKHAIFEVRSCYCNKSKHLHMYLYVMLSYTLNVLKIMCYVDQVM